MANDLGGVWRTIGGRRIFIKDGQDLASAMKESGKFSKKQKEASERLNKNAENGVRSDIKDFLSGREDYDGSKEDFIRDLANEWLVDKDKVEEILREESSKHPRNFTGGKISDEQREKNVKDLKSKYQEYLKKYDYDKEKPEGQKMTDLFKKEDVKGIGQSENKQANNSAYKKAFEEYKKKHPNTKLNLQKFIKMSEE